MNAGKKYCRYCDAWLETPMFAKRRASPDGLSHKCRICASAYGKLHYPTIRDSAIASSAAWRKRNPQKRKEICARYREKNVAKRKASDRKRIEYLRATSPDVLRVRYRVGAANRRSKVAAAGGHVTPQWWQAVMDTIETGVCMYCRTVCKKLVMDHFVPVKLGGKTEVGNLLPCCSDCNNKKRASDPQVWVPVNCGGQSAYDSIVLFLNCTRAAFEEFSHPNIEHREV